jgi:hypothetical protein
VAERPLLPARPGPPPIYPHCTAIGRSGFFAWFEARRRLRFLVPRNETAAAESHWLPIVILPLNSFAVNRSGSDVVGISRIASGPNVAALRAATF